jgi:hypothetical protein
MKRWHKTAPKTESLIYLFYKKTKEFFLCSENNIRPVQCTNTASFTSFLIGVASGKPPHFFYISREKYEKRESMRKL